MDENRRCSTIGNGFHIPSVVVMLLLLLNIPHALAFQAFTSLPDVLGPELPFLLPPHIAMTCDEFLDSLLHLFAEDTFLPQDIGAARQSLTSIDLRPFFWFHRYASMMARPQE
eukprot:5261132-Amphidinium_carterae.1